ncbi:putative HTH-type transcriptional regulator ybaQ [Rickettsiales bacterium Ac37b]|nr:putative HTH-type transcriptional regulator ybaQ [Rickettsiales bacterium Ac37b]
MFNPPHPGEILKEFYLEPLDLTITKSAEYLGITRKTLSSLINGNSGISPEMALRLSKAFANSNPEYWLNLQQQYDLWKAKQHIDTTNIKILIPSSSIEKK